MLCAETSPLDEPFAIEPASEEEIAMIEEGMAPLAGIRGRPVLVQGLEDDKKGAGACVTESGRTTVIPMRAKDLDRSLIRKILSDIALTADEHNGMF